MITLLTEEQIYGKNQLDIIKKYGSKCAITDFAILLGGYVAQDYYTSEGKTLKDRTGWWWTKTPAYDNARVVDILGISGWNYVDKRNGGARPALTYSTISSITSNGVRGRSEVKEVQYGEYPQTIVDEIHSRELERLYNNGALKTTGKKYTTDSVRWQDVDKPFMARKHIEYEYNGNKYIRFVADSNCAGEVLSDGRTIIAGNVYWVKVEPIIWLVDERANIALAKKIIFSGVQFNRKRNYQGNFEDTNMYWFLNKIFAKDIIPSIAINNTVDDVLQIVNNIMIGINQNSDLSPKQKIKKISKLSTILIEGITQLGITHLQNDNQETKKKKNKVKKV